MPRYEYKVVPAPTKGLKAKGVKGAEGRFAHAVQELMNGLSGYGWEYLRAETLPCVERSGLTGSTTEWRNMLVFRRLREGETDAFAPELLTAPAMVAATGASDAVAQTAPVEDQVADRAVKNLRPQRPRPPPRQTQRPRAQRSRWQMRQTRTNMKISKMTHGTMASRIPMM